MEIFFLKKILFFLIFIPGQRYLKDLDPLAEIFVRYRVGLQWACTEENFYLNVSIKYRVLLLFL